MKNLIKYSIFALSFIFSTCYAKDDEVTLLRHRYEQLSRIDNILWRLRTANNSKCTDRIFDYGITSVSLTLDAKAETYELWHKALKIDRELSTIVMVAENSPAHKSGIKPGDMIAGINEKEWPTDSREEKDTFKKMLSDIINHPSIQFTIKRDANETFNITLKSENICNINFKIQNEQKFNASAIDKNILVGENVAQLLNNDNELAYLLSHEMAHILLGHSKEEFSKNLSNENTRKKIEIEADILGIHLMHQAGYDPFQASNAEKKLYLSNHGPISRLLGINGPYLPTKERQKLLNEIAKQVSQ